MLDILLRIVPTDKLFFAFMKFELEGVNADGERLLVPESCAEAKSSLEVYGCAKFHLLFISRRRKMCGLGPGPSFTASLAEEGGESTWKLRRMMSFS